MNRLPSIVHRHWTVVLIVLGIFLFAVNSLIFYPGYMSPDSFSQYNQALGDQSLGDLHPPIMVIVWKLLLMKPQLILAFQLGLLWSSLLLLSIIVFKKTRSLKLSLLPLFAGLLPFILNLSGVIWKDVHMTFALLLAVVLLLTLRSFSLGRWRYAVFIGIFFLIAYACLLRHNAFFAVLPLIYLALHDSGLVRRVRYKLALTFASILAILTLGIAINVAMAVEKEHPASSVMLDDVINIKQQGKFENITNPLRSDLTAIQQRCKDNGVVMNSYWACANDEQRRNVRQDQYDQLAEYWVKTIASSPLRYMAYRIETFSIFLFAPDKYAYIWHSGVDMNAHGIEVKNAAVGRAVEVYVKDFGYKHLSFLFQPWFWLAINIIILCSNRKFNEYRNYIIVLSMSSIMYIVGYAPVVVAVDYRYIYWPAIATMIILLLVFLERQAVKQKV